ncbi:MAG: hypothetical protein CMJ64_08550 [Planctomycetaceae bacterium]|nr:hypothetical protein [Planctomycetaceae bacterium]
MATKGSRKTARGIRNRCSLTIAAAKVAGNDSSDVGGGIYNVAASGVDYQVSANDSPWYAVEPTSRISSREEFISAVDQLAAEDELVDLGLKAFE